MSDYILEEKLLNDIDYVIGVDEVGRGCLAGPICVAAFLLSKDDLNTIKLDKEFLGVDDSKKVSKKKRERLNSLLKQFKHTLSLRDNTYIDEKGLSLTLYECINESVTELLKLTGGSDNYLVLIDGVFPKKFTFNYKTVIDGDAKHFVISGASIIAKVYRDKIMEEQSQIFPGYNFEKNVGYGTKKHFDAIKEKGITKIHRKSFEPIKSMLKGH
ncbi:MAG: ribonuclease HII [bacterium]